MRLLTGTVVAGEIRLDEPGVAPEGSRVTVIVEDDDVPVEDIPIQADGPLLEPTVLVVEDDPDLCEAFCEVLEAAGYNVVTARDGREAIGYLKTARNRPHLILLDVRMPNMDGVEFRKHQIALAGAASIPVVVTSADGNLHGVLEQMKAQAFLAKPVGRSELVATVSRLCDDDE
jgi:CheY-like chemotaxis protein